MASCPEDSYADLSTGMCSPCTEPCQSCNGGGGADCVSCMQGYYFLEPASTCQTDCPHGYYEGKSKGTDQDWGSSGYHY